MTEYYIGDLDMSGQPVLSKLKVALRLSNGQAENWSADRKFSLSYEEIWNMMKIGGYLKGSEGTPLWYGVFTADESGTVLGFR